MEVSTAPPLLVLDLCVCLGDGTQWFAPQAWRDVLRLRPHLHGFVCERADQGADWFRGSNLAASQRHRFIRLSFLFASLPKPRLASRFPDVRGEGLLGACTALLLLRRGGHAQGKGQAECWCLPPDSRKGCLWPGPSATCLLLRTALDLISPFLTAQGISVS